MKAKKAIELLTYSSEHDTILLSQDDKDALKLGIEALKEVIRARDGDPALDGELLPGETED